jgi:hypothetical protein
MSIIRIPKWRWGPGVLNKYSFIISLCRLYFALRSQDYPVTYRRRSAVPMWRLRRRHPRMRHHDDLEEFFALCPFSPPEVPQGN